NFKIYLIPFCLFGLLLMNSCKREGCTDPKAINYDKKAKKDDGSCIFQNTTDGSTDEENTDDGSDSSSLCEQPDIECLVATKIVENTDFKGRTGHGCVVFNNKIYIIGGVNVVNSTAYNLNDVWSSSDGQNWTEEVSEAPFPKRAYHAVLVHDNKLWVIGGRTNGYDLLNDVWYSSDGVNWVEATSNAPFSKRQFHQAISFQNDIYLTGGGVVLDDGDVWKSSDGITWTLITETAAIGGRTHHRLDVYDNKIWLFSGSLDGYQKRDVWYSGDAINWTEVNVEEPFTNRMDASSFIYNNKFFTLGGVFGNAQSDEIRNDFWLSSDSGVNWSQYAAPQEDFLDRKYYRAVPLNGYIYIIGGRVNDVDSEDIWKIEIP
ncbi:MAG: hypothetical protein WEA99_01410, partial [Brumimicrobium sp.]